MASSDGSIFVDDYDVSLQWQLDPANPDEYRDQEASEQAQAYLNFPGITVYNNTLTGIASQGLILSYKFSGSWVQVVGVEIPWIAGDNAIVDFSLDGSLNKTYNAPDVSAPTASVRYYLAYNLSPLDQHTLLINVTRATPNSPFLLDYIAYDAGDTSQTPTGTPSSPPTATTDPASSLLSLPMNSTSSSSNSASTTQSKDITAPPATVTVTASQSDSLASASPTGNNNEDSAATSRAFPFAPVIGGIVGGVVVLSALFALLYYCWKREQRYPEASEDDGSKPGRSNDPVETKPPQKPTPSMDTDSIVPTLPPGSVYPASSSTPSLSTMQVAGVGGTQPLWVPLAPQQQWASSAASTPWQPQYAPFPDTSRTPTMYSSSVGWDQWSSYSLGNTSPPASWAQSGYFPHGSTMYSAGNQTAPIGPQYANSTQMSAMDGPSSPPMLAYPNTAYSQASVAASNGGGGYAAVPAVPAPVPGSAPAIPGVEGVKPRFQVATPTGPNSDTRHVPSVTVPATSQNPLPSDASGPTPPAPTDSSNTEIDSSTGGSARRLGGVLDWVGKESRLASVQPPEAGGPSEFAPDSSDECNDTGKSSGSTSPPAYVP
ncbi:hypothetical protein BD413DRAFT_612132 [Trametes elegans]|nr:hypothetical protein BD413DRAFT_612132 [Trametes elegans]